MAQGRFCYVYEALVDVAPILWMYGGFTRAKSGTKIGDVIPKGYCSASIGYTGLAETVYRFGIEYLAKQGVDGVSTTRTNIVKIAREYNLISLQRFFMIDSHSVSTSIESMKLSNPDIVEIMPAIVTKKIKDMHDRPLLIFSHPWSIQTVLERNEGLKLSEFGNVDF